MQIIKMAALTFAVVLVVFCLCADQVSGGLRKGDPGVCERKAKVIMQKQLVANITKQCGKKICTHRQIKILKYTVTRNTGLTECCQGWSYKNSTKKCMPNCDKGCHKGTCTSPNVCRCKPPLYLDTTNNNTCIPPVCSQACVNSKCSEPDTCTCQNNYTPVNKTHCAPKCSSKYTLDAERLICNPVCTKPCDNGTCIRPDLCACNLGFIFMNNKCVPNCEPNCENSNCVAPNVCSCNDGYEATEKKWQCKAFCENCDNGTCIAPSTCVCNAGFQIIEEVCRPFCVDECVNGYCSLYGKCECKKGFEKGVCYGKNATIEEHGKFSNCTRTRLTSYNGTKGEQMFENESVVNAEDIICCTSYNFESDTCVPICTKGCQGGTCVDPDVCYCEPPLVLNENQNVCIKPCSKDCVKGTCEGSDTCLCDEGYSLSENERHVCVPTCNPQCNNAECIAPDTCECHNGYKISGDNARWNCTPECGACSNGYCEQPNVCVCYKGYKTVNGECQPQCDSCEHGQCIAPNSCRCDDGFVEDITCVPARTLAGMHLAWICGGVIVILLITAVTTVILARSSHRRKKPISEVADFNTGIIMDTAFNTLNISKIPEEAHPRDELDTMMHSQGDSIDNGNEQEQNHSFMLINKNTMF